MLQKSSRNQPAGPGWLGRSRGPAGGLSWHLVQSEFAVLIVRSSGFFSNPRDSTICFSPIPWGGVGRGGCVVGWNKRSSGRSTKEGGLGTWGLVPSVLLHAPPEPLPLPFALFSPQMHLQVHTWRTEGGRLNSAFWEHPSLLSVRSPGRSSSVAQEEIFPFPREEMGPAGLGYKASWHRPVPLLFGEVIPSRSTSA